MVGIIFQSPILCVYKDMYRYKIISMVIMISPVASHCKTKILSTICLKFFCKLSLFVVFKKNDF